ncbi:MAG: hypothetical protein ACK53Y_11340, partial [bacterium]
YQSVCIPSDIGYKSWSAVEASGYRCVTIFKLTGCAVDVSDYRVRSPETTILRREDPLCGVIPDACGVLTRLEFIHGEKPFLRESNRRA